MAIKSSASIDMLKSYIAVAGTVVMLLVLVLGANSIKGQDSENQELVGGCPSDSLAFHQCALEKAKTFDPPRTPDGQPDMRGYWRGRHNGAAFNIEPGERSFALQQTFGVIVDQPDRLIPYQPWALAQRNEFLEQLYNDPQAHCAPSGSPRKNFTNYGWKILQVPNYFLFVYESMHDYRIIPTDGRSHLPESIKLWHGDPLGHWEGNTFVVDFTNLNGRHWFDMSGNFQSDNIHVVERYTLIDPDTIHFEAKIEDSTMYTSPWTISFPFMRNTEINYYQLEYACHEGERDLQHLIPTTEHN